MDYAAYAIYAALMKRQLDQLMPGADIDDYTVVLDQCYGKSPLNNAFKEAINKEMDAEMAPLLEQLNMSFSVAPSSWVQRVQQSKNPLQLVKDEGQVP